jgi:hypothetical protein
MDNLLEKMIPIEKKMIPDFYNYCILEKIKKE